MAPSPTDPSTGLNAAVAAELRAEQGRQKITVPALAEIADVPYGSLRRYLNADRHIDVAVLDALASALGLTATDVIRAAQERLSQAPAGKAGEASAGIRELDAELRERRAARNEANAPVTQAARKPRKK